VPMNACENSSIWPSSSMITTPPRCAARCMAGSARPLERSYIHAVAANHPAATAGQQRRPGPSHDPHPVTQVFDAD
jgi:hypothetical protein